MKNSLLKTQTWLTSFLSQSPNYLQLVKDREGLVLKWYNDSLGKLTAGYGHLQRPQDRGITVTKEIAEQWLKEDIQTALEAATKQADELPFVTPELFDVLVSVNFQLGTSWNTKFKNTWALLKAGQYDRAAAESENSLWAKQTPVRVRDFQRALWRASVLGDKVS